MSKDYYVLRGGKVVYKPGHYDIDGARAVAKLEARAHPRATITVVKIEEQYSYVSHNGEPPRGVNKTKEKNRG